MTMTKEAADPYIGRTYAWTNGPRDRHIKVVSTAPPSMFFPAGYYYQLVMDKGSTRVRTNRVRISAASLDKIYTEVAE